MSNAATPPAVSGAVPDVVDGVQVGRLLKLAEHLERGKLGHSVFDFDVMCVQRKCGTAGCAIGECPWAFPDEWELVEIYSSWDNGPPLLDPQLKRDSLGDGWDDAKEFFGLTDEQARSLFMPDHAEGDFGSYRRYNGIRLGKDATPKQVAANIRAFVDMIALCSSDAAQAPLEAATTSTEDAAASQEDEVYTVSKDSAEGEDNG